MGRGLSADSRALIQRAYEVLAVEHPSGVRRVCYALYGNQAEAFVKKVGKQLANARRRGLIPWEWISDDTRPSVRPYVTEDMADFATASACPSYDPWPGQGVRIVVWSEKSLGGTLQPLIDEYLFEFQVHHGNSSWTQFRQYAQWTKQHPHLRLIILYVGDHDCKGLRISEDDIPKRMRDRAAINWQVKRVAILQPDAERVPVADRDALKPKDPDISWYCSHTGLHYGVEVESLPSPELRSRVEAALRAEITDAGAWHRTMAASEAVRDSWRAYLDRWPIPTLGVE